MIKKLDVWKGICRWITIVRKRIWSHTNVFTEMQYAAGADPDRGELSYLAPLGSENISASYFKQCFFRGGITPTTLSQTPRLPVPRQK